MATRYPAADRIVAVGDLHGDLQATRRALRIAGAIDEADRWIGQTLVVVQTGDQLDRGDDEPEILTLLERLAVEAAAVGGAIHVLNGNHELMNAAGDLRYVTDEGFRDFAAMAGLPTDRPELAEVPPKARSRLAAFLPGGPYALMLAKRNVIVIVGDTVFVHGGVLPQHVSYGIERINDEVRRWLADQSSDPGAIVRMISAPDSPVWTRAYSDATGPEECEMLSRTLEMVNATRMVVGHTPQLQGITSACEGKVWRVDVGMARHYGGRPQVLELAGDRVRVIGDEAAATAK